MVLVFDTVNNVFQLLHVGGLLLDDSVYRCVEGSVEDVGCVVHGCYAIPSLSSGM